MFGLSPFAGEIPRHSATCRVHCQAIPNLFLVIVQKAWEEKNMKLCTFNCFFFLFPWEGSGLEVSSPVL